MKRIILILLAVIITLPSCTQKKPVVKKERIYTIMTTSSAPEHKSIYTEITEYNKDGYKLQTIQYNQEGEIIGEHYCTYDGKKNTNIKLVNKIYGGIYDEDEEVAVFEIYYDKDKNKWVNKYNNTFSDHQPVKFEYLTDDIIDINMKTYMLDEDVIYKGQYTKYDDNGNWIEAEEETTYITIKSTHKNTLVREILEYWD